MALLFPRCLKNKKDQPDWFIGEYRGFKGEYKVKFWDPAWHDIIYAGSDSYIDRITAAGFDGVILDNVEFFDDYE
ncbi:MAG: endo alpha-1,4 polygalactosaminidase [Bacteroidia bacterium]